MIFKNQSASWKCKILVHLKANNISIDKIIHKQKITIFELFPHLISFNELVWQEHNGKLYHR